MTAPVRVAIVGAGLMGRWHAHAAVRAGARVALFVDPNSDRAAQLAGRYAGARSLVQFDASRIARDAVIAHVCTPLATHDAIVAELLAAGVHVLAEKPLTDDADSTRVLLESANAHGVLLCPVHQMPFQRGVQSLMDALPTLGELLHVEFATCTAGAAGRGPSLEDYLVDDILPHPLSLFRRVLGGEMARLQWQIARPRAGELRAMATVGATIASIVVSTHGRPTSNSLRVIGERGTASVDLFHGYAVLRRGRVSRLGKILGPFADAGATATRAAANLVVRAADREPAYPGLANLVRSFHAAATLAAPTPISPGETLDIALARDRLRAVSPRR